MENLNVEKLKDDDDEYMTKNIGCCIIKLRFINCVTSKSKVFGKSKSKKDGTRYSPVTGPVLSSSTSNAGSATSSASKKEEELKISDRLRKFTFNDLKEATQNFKPECLIGQGGFGCVFKGQIYENCTSPVKREEGLIVAVKTLNRHGVQGHKEWLAEVNYLGQLSHPNLVTLIGYCNDGDKRLLVYEFMRRGSLEHHLFKRRTPLPWPIRMKIALGTAKGLAFLHEESEKPVIYRDVKTSNILLDKDYNAKLSDFGLAKDGPEEGQSHVSTRVMGTYGYAAPEYVMTGHLTTKSDVYSFGVVLLEMISGRTAVDKNRPNGEDNLVEWARPYLGDARRFYRVIDSRLEGQFSIIGSQTTVQLAARCLSRDPKARPLMSEVVQALNPLPNLNDMAASTCSFLTMQEHYSSRATPSPRHGQAVGIRSRNNGKRPAVRSPSIPKVSQASPSHHRHQYNLSPNSIQKY